MRMNVAKSVRDQRGVALPIAMLVLVVLMALTFAFSTLATTEGVVGRNHSMAQQGRAFAESGVERAIWALNNSQVTFTGSTADQADYRGENFLRVSANGGFRLTITEATSIQRNVTAVGWAPDDTGQLRAVKKIQATATKLVWGTVAPPGALSVKGNLDVGGNATIDARSNHCAGSTPQGGSVSTGVTTLNTGQGDNANIYGYGDDTPNQLGDYPQGPTNTVPTMAWDDLQLLKSLAMAAGTYYQGPTEFNNSNRLPSQGGIVFVDTTTGNDLTTGPPATPTSEMGNVTVTGNQTWSGWIIAIGDVTVTGTVNLTGSIYTRNDFVFNGNGQIRGAVTAENTLLTVQSSIDSSAGGSSTILYDCSAAQTGGGTVTSKWLVKLGTFREVEGQ